MSGPRKHWEYAVSRRCFPDVAYSAGVQATASPSAEAHMFAGIGCGGCVAPLALAQRLLDGDPVDDAELGGGGLRVLPMTRLPYAALDHLLEAFRAEPELRAPENLRDVIDAVADDLAYTSRREIQSSDRHPYHLTCVAAALLLRRLTGTDRELPRVWETTVERAQRILADELAG